MINHGLKLDYQLAPGWLKPWSDGVLRGQAVARKCASCDRVSFTPLRTCDCGESAGSWETLSGRADILDVSEGAEGCFGLVRFEGADTCCVARLQGLAPGSARARIIRPKGMLPSLILAPMQIEAQRS